MLLVFDSFLTTSGHNAFANKNLILLQLYIVIHFKRNVKISHILLQRFALKRVFVSANKYSSSNNIIIERVNTEKKILYRQKS